MPLAKFYRYLDQINEIELSKRGDSGSPGAALEKMMRKAQRG